MFGSFLTPPALAKEMNGSTDGTDPCLQNPIGYRPLSYSYWCVPAWHDLSPQLCCNKPVRMLLLWCCGSCAPFQVLCITPRSRWYPDGSSRRSYFLPSDGCLEFDGDRLCCISSPSPFRWWLESYFDFRPLVIIYVIGLMTIIYNFNGTNFCTTPFR